MGDGTDLGLVGTGGNGLRRYFRPYTHLDRTGAPMSYLWNGKQYIVVAIGGADHPAEWVALGLP